MSKDYFCAVMLAREQFRFKKRLKITVITMFGSFSFTQHETNQTKLYHYKVNVLFQLTEHKTQVISTNHYQLTLHCCNASSCFFSCINCFVDL